MSILTILTLAPFVSIIEWSQTVPCYFTFTSIGKSKFNALFKYFIFPRKKVLTLK